VSGFEVIRRLRWQRVGVLAALAALPLALCAGLAWNEAGRAQRREAALAAGFIANEVQAMLGQAREATRDLRGLALGNCDEAVPELMRRAAVTPYVRSLNVLENGIVHCSSAAGLVSTPLRAFADDAPARVPDGSWVALVGGTPLVPGRLALLVGEPVGDRLTSLAVVDDRYVRDLLRAVAPPELFARVDLRIGDGRAFQEGEATDAPAAVRSGIDPVGTHIEVRIHGAPQRHWQVLRGLLLQWLPVAVLLSILLAGAGYRLQRMQRSRREQLLHGIRAGEFHVEYQPLYGVASGRCEGAEALLRWSRPGHGPTSPEVFIAAAEDKHVIVSLTRHMLGLVARDFDTLAVQSGFHIGINFAPEHLSGDMLQEDVGRFLDAVARRGVQTVVEITERTLIDNTDRARENLEALRRRGVLVAIDDFGTGYCSLSYLRKFPFDYLKIDKGFVQTIEPHPEPQSALILDAIIDLSDRLGACQIAEGVDSWVQFDYLARRGVELIQGYLVARPMPAAEFMRWYAVQGQRPLARPAEAVPPVAGGAADETAAQRPVSG